MPDHRVTEEWFGETVETLEDLLWPNLRAVVVGINPSQVSVEAGHYYQGRLGLLFYKRMTAAGLLDEGVDRGAEDDALFASGIGFTDLVKRPSARAKELSSAELVHGRQLLEAKLQGINVPLVIFTYKQTAQLLYGPFKGAGFLPTQSDAADRFVMPGPYAPVATAESLLQALRQYLAAPGCDA